jgi:hypothetical protein
MSVVQGGSARKYDAGKGDHRLHPVEFLDTVSWRKV